jgi:MFS family permease
MAVQAAAFERESSYAYVRLLAALTLMTVGGAGMFAISVALKPIAAEFGASRSDAAIAYAAVTIGFGAGGILMGRWADRSGVMVPALFGSAALALGFVAAGHATAMWQLHLAQGLLVGFLGNAAVFAPLVADVTHWFHRKRGIAVAIVISGNYVAGTIWPPITQIGIDLWGWRATFTGIGVFCLLSMLPLSLLLYRPVPHGAAGAQASDQASARPLGVRPATLQVLLSAAGVGCCVAMAMPQVHIVAYASDLGHAAQRGAEMLSLMLGTGVLSRLACGWLSDRIGGLKTLLASSALQCVALLLFLPVDGLAALYLISALFGLSQGGIVPAYAIIVRAFFPPAEAGWRIGTVMMFTLVGMGLGGWLAGLLYDLTGSYRAAFVNAVGFNVMNTAIAVFLLRQAWRLGVRG